MLSLVQMLPQVSLHTPASLGKSGTSPIQRPSTSCSSSTVNVTHSSSTCSGRHHRTAGRQLREVAFVHQAPACGRRGPPSGPQPRLRTLRRLIVDAYNLIRRSPGR